MSGHLPHDRRPGVVEVARRPVGEPGERVEPVLEAHVDDDAEHVLRVVTRRPRPRRGRATRPGGGAGCRCSRRAPMARAARAAAASWRSAASASATSVRPASPALANTDRACAAGRSANRSSRSGLTPAVGPGGGGGAGGIGAAAGWAGGGGGGAGGSGMSVVPSAGDRLPSSPRARSMRSAARAVPFVACMRVETAASRSRSASSARSSSTAPSSSPSSKSYVASRRPEPGLVDALRVVDLVPEQRQHDHRLAVVEATRRPCCCRRA